MILWQSLCRIKAIASISIELLIHFFLFAWSFDYRAFVICNDDTHLTWCYKIDPTVNAKTFESILEHIKYHFFERQVRLILLILDHTRHYLSSKKLKGLDFLGMFNINFGLITRELSENYIPLEKFMAIAFFKKINITELMVYFEFCRVSYDHFIVY